MNDKLGENSLKKKIRKKLINETIPTSFANGDKMKFMQTSFLSQHQFFYVHYHHYV